MLTKECSVQFPFIFKRENMVRYEDGSVLIFDRRVYPFKKQFVHCKTYEDTAKAIEDMVTQSGGPGIAAGYGMVQAAHEHAKLSGKKLSVAMEKAALRFVHTRPTCNYTETVVNSMLALANIAIQDGKDLEKELMQGMDRYFEQRHQFGMAVGIAGASVVKDGDAILNHCWAERGIVYTLYVALCQGKKIRAYCSETRPYLQGARLTADAIADMGIDTTVITDGMSAHLMSKGMITKFFAGADRVTMDGSVINKIGTLMHAICAHNFDIPFYAFCLGPDRESPNPDFVTIEERNPDEVLYCLGNRTATPKAKGYYPAFDITPPKFVGGIITDKGVFSPYTLDSYFDENNKSRNQRFV
jgi:methylthioribose-1-phosphate isomerase